MDATTAAKRERTVAVKEDPAKWISAFKRLEEKTGEKVPNYVPNVIDVANNLDFLKPGVKPLNPEGAMTPVERNRRHFRELLKKIDPSKLDPAERLEYEEKLDYYGFADALFNFERGAYVARAVGKNNRYLKALYKTAVSPRSVRSLTRNGQANAIRLGRLMERYGIFKRDEDKSAPNYIITGKGKEFLCALYPGLRKVIEGDLKELQSEDYLEGIMRP